MRDNGRAVAVLPAPGGVLRLFDRARTLLQRRDLDGAEVLRFGDLRLDPDTREVCRARRTIELTPIEFSLLEVFLRNPRRVLTRSLLFNRVWGFDFGVGSNSLTVYVSRLRQKTEAAGEQRLIHTIRGVGYVLREPAAVRPTR